VINFRFLENYRKNDKDIRASNSFYKLISFHSTKYFYRAFMV